VYYNIEDRTHKIPTEVWGSEILELYLKSTCPFVHIFNSFLDIIGDVFDKHNISLPFT
jgi:hypothetical protein